jgi:hypothetical protein
MRCHPFNRFMIESYKRFGHGLLPNLTERPAAARSSAKLDHRRFAADESARTEFDAELRAWMMRHK